MSEMATHPHGGRPHASTAVAYLGAETIRVRSMGVTRPGPARANSGARVTAWIVRLLITGTTGMALWDLLILATHTHG
ncbi:MAG: hypothetical protein ABSG81_05700 [Acidimicrobiales bacterium]